MRQSSRNGGGQRGKAARMKRTVRKSSTNGTGIEEEQQEFREKCERAAWIERSIRKSSRNGRDCEEKQQELRSRRKSSRRAEAVRRAA